MSRQDLRFVPLLARTVVVHTVTYVFMGLLAVWFLDYESAFAQPYMSCWMRQMSDPMIIAGPLFQPIRGIVFGLAIYPLREIIFSRRRGWLILFWLLVAFGMVNTFGPAPGSLEGLVYTVIPVRVQLMGYLEIVPQAFLFAYGLFYWTNHSERKWVTWVMVAAFLVALGLPMLGLFMRASGV